LQEFAASYNVMTKIQKFAPKILCTLVLWMPGNVMLGQPAPPAPPPGQSLAPDQLDGLVAPIALYPDPISGRLEILARRVGRNELNTMEICRGYVEAQLEYASADRDKDGVLKYAQNIASSPGKQDGLYSEDAAQNPVTKAFRAAAGGAKGEPYHGYYFHVLKSQGPAATGGAFDYVVQGKMIGGFALVAWPAEYGVSGVQTFIIDHEGLLYGKDLGTNTAALARQMTRFNPDRSWRRVELE
jgi:hypothetical protein